MMKGMSSESQQAFEDLKGTFRKNLFIPLFIRSEKFRKNDPAVQESLKIFKEKYGDEQLDPAFLVTLGIQLLDAGLWIFSVNFSFC